MSRNYHGRLTNRRLNRRSLLGGTAGAMAVGLSVRFGTRAEARAQAANIQSWGFNAVETNPLAFGRFRAFQEAYPEIIVELSPDSENQRILTAAVSGTLPDLLWLGRGALNSYLTRGSVLRSLSDLIERDSYDLSRFYPAAIEESTYDDQVWGIPGGIDVSAMYVNTEAVAEAGVSDASTLSSTEYQQLTDLGAQLTTRDGDAVTRWGFDPKTQDGQFYEWAEAAGAEFLGGDDGLQPQFNTPEIAGVLERGIAAYEAQGGYRSYEAVRQSWQNDEQFARGQVAITVYQNWMLGIMSATAPEREFTVLPMHPDSDPSAISAVSGGNAWCISENSQNVDAAWEFIKFMHTDETWMIGAQTVKDARIAAGRPYIPSLTGVPAVDQRQIEELYEPIAPKWDNAVQLFPQILAASSMRPLSPSPYAQQLDQIMIQTGVLPALRGERPVQEALDAAQAEAESAISGFCPPTLEPQPRPGNHPGGVVVRCLAGRCLTGQRRKSYGDPARSRRRPRGTQAPSYRRARRSASRLDRDQPVDHRVPGPDAASHGVVALPRVHVL